MLCFFHAIQRRPVGARSVPPGRKDDLAYAAAFEGVVQLPVRPGQRSIEHVFGLKGTEGFLVIHQVFWYFGIAIVLPRTGGNEVIHRLRVGRPALILLRRRWGGRRRRLNVICGGVYRQLGRQDRP